MFDVARITSLLLGQGGLLLSHQRLLPLQVFLDALRQVLLHWLLPHHVSLELCPFDPIRSRGC